jgi:hypothetical protein
MTFVPNQTSTLLDASDLLRQLATVEMEKKQIEGREGPIGVTIGGDMRKGRTLPVDVVIVRGMLDMVIELLKERLAKLGISVA